MRLIARPTSSFRSIVRATLRPFALVTLVLGIVAAPPAASAVFAQAPAATTLYSPYGTVTAVSPTFTWAAVPKATYYYLWVSDRNGIVLQRWYSAASAGCGAGTGQCSVATGVGFAGELVWWVQTWNSSGEGPWSAAAAFRRGTPPASAIPLSPSGATSATPVFTWQAVSSATHYRLWVNDTRGTVIHRWYASSDVGCGAGSGTCSIATPTPLVGAGQWWLQTWNSTGGYGAWSSAAAFYPQVASTSGAVKLRVVQWNLHHGVGMDGVYDIDRIASWLARFQPDIVLLNEVEKNTYWGREDQPERYRAMLEAKTGRRWYSHFSQEFGAWSSAGKGHQVLSVYPFDSVSHTTITQSSGLNWAGAASQAGITVNGRTINFIVSHLDPLDRDMRLIQAKDVIRWASGFAENRILAGDMNAWPDQTSILEINKTYYDGWTVAANKGTATGISGISPFGATKSGRIDYIFFSKNAPNLVVLNSWTPDTRDSSGYMPSDHRPVVTTFEVR